MTWVPRQIALAHRPAIPVDAIRTAVTAQRAKVGDRSVRLPEHGVELGVILCRGLTHNLPSIVDAIRSARGPAEGAEGMEVLDRAALPQHGVSLAKLFTVPRIRSTAWHGSPGRPSGCSGPQSSDRCR